MKISQTGAFTLLELLVVIAIISILASIAIPKFSDYRKRAFDTRALSDLRNTAAAQELYFLENEEYFNCTDSECEMLPGVSRLSRGVTLSMQQGSSPDSLLGEASNSSGTGRVFRWDSSQGGLLED